MCNLPPWTDEYLVGSYLIDVQNQRLHRLCGQLLDYCAHESHNELPTLLKEFEGLARMHFETEEALLAQNQCPTLEPHRVEHAFYLAQIECLRDQSPIPMQSLSSLLGTWIGEHIGGTDMNDKYYMQDRRKWVAQRAKDFGPIDV
jgi:hemerythrin